MRLASHVPQLARSVLSAASPIVQPDRQRRRDPTAVRLCLERPNVPAADPAATHRGRRERQIRARPRSSVCCPACSAAVCCFDLGSRPCSCDHASLAVRLAPESEERGVSLSIAMSASGGRLPNSMHGKPIVSIHRRVAVLCFVLRPRLERPSSISVAAEYASRSSASMSMSSSRDGGATTVHAGTAGPCASGGSPWTRRAASLRRPPANDTRYRRFFLRASRVSLMGKGELWKERAHPPKQRTDGPKERTDGVLPTPK